MTFKHYSEEDYEALCGFLIALNRPDKNHIHWNWARFEWMYEHPECDKSLLNKIGLWLDDGRIVGAAIYDMYLGEAFCGVLRGYESLYPEVLDYSYRELSDENGLGIAVCDDSIGEIEAAASAGFTKAEQTETLMSIAFDHPLPVSLPDGYAIRSLDPAEDIDGFQWLLWQGFDHGSDRAEFEREDPIDAKRRRHFDPRLSLAAVDPSGEDVAYCCLWYEDSTDYAYVEPLCVIPPARGKGLAKALVCEGLNRVASLGARKAYVISDMAFYKRLGFNPEKHFTFYWKTP